MSVDNRATPLIFGFLSVDCGGYSGSFGRHVPNNTGFQGKG